jgi:cell division protein FtsB
MENYQWSITWWIFRLVTLGEIAAIFYLFYTTWKLNKGVKDTHSMMFELLKAKRSYDGQSASLDAADSKIAALHQEFKRKDYND